MLPASRERMLEDISTNENKAKQYWSKILERMDKQYGKKSYEYSKKALRPQFT